MCLALTSRGVSERPGAVQGTATLVYAGALNTTWRDASVGCWCAQLILCCAVLHCSTRVQTRFVVRTSLHSCALTTACWWSAGGSVCKHCRA